MFASSAKTIFIKTMIYILPIIIGLVFNRFLSRKNLCWLLVIMYTLIGALRSIYVGFDTRTYQSHFNQTQWMGWDQILQYYGDEPGYYALCKILNNLGCSFQILLAVISIISMLAFGRLIYQYSKSVITSFAMLVPFQYYGFTLSGERQTIALSIILLAFPLILQRKFIKYLICVGIAYLFHHSALVAIPLYFLLIKRVTYKKRLIILSLTPLIFALRQSILHFVLLYFYSDYSIYENESGSYATLLLYIVIWGVYAATRKTDSDRVANFCEMAALTGIIIQMFVPLEPNIYRIGFYYQIFNILLLPLAISNLSSIPLKKIAYASAFTFFIILYSKFTYSDSGVNPYSFYWNPTQIVQYENTTNN